MNTKTALCLICFKPNEIWINFLKRFIHYDVYIIIDDNSISYDNYDNNIHFIQILNEDCETHGFTDMNFVIRKKISGWEKAVFYFSTINTLYNNIWFFEDDVFFYNEQSLMYIDSKYKDGDLLSNIYVENSNGHKNDWHWEKININSNPPYYRCMCCIIRVSIQMLYHIKEYANTYKSLFFLEALFPTICKGNNLKIYTPEEFINVQFRKDYTIYDINELNLYHPVKDMENHILFRAMRILSVEM